MIRTALITLLGLTLATLAAAEPPARTDILAQCPALADQLPERLASAKHQFGREGQVRVELVVDDQGLKQIASIEGARLYKSRVRSALEDLDCKAPAGTSQRYVLNIRFEEPGASPLPVATPTFAQAASH